MRWERLKEQTEGVYRLREGVCSRMNGCRRWKQEKSLSMKNGGLAEGAREREGLSFPKGGWDKGKAMGNPQGMWPEMEGEIVI